MEATPKEREIFEREQKAYWTMRESLLQTHWGKWVVVVDGQVVAVGDNKAQALQEAFRRTGSRVGFVTKVGFEKAVQRKTIRRIAFGQYDFPESLLRRDVLNEFRLTLSAPENIVRLEIV